MDSDVNVPAPETPEEAGVPDTGVPAEAVETLDPRDAALADAEARANDYEDRWLRLAADFENFRRRVARERELAMEQGAERALHTVFRVIDDLERAAEAATAENVSVDAVREGVALVLQQARQALADSGIDIVDPLGEPFDPAKHEAVMRDPAGEANAVTRVLSRGYVRDGRVLRPAHVVVGG